MFWFWWQGWWNKFDSIHQLSFWYGNILELFTLFQDTTSWLVSYEKRRNDSDGLWISKSISTCFFCSSHVLASLKFHCILKSWCGPNPRVCKALWEITLISIHKNGNMDLLLTCLVMLYLRWVPFVVNLGDRYRRATAYAADPRFQRNLEQKGFGHFGHLRTRYKQRMGEAGSFGLLDLIRKRRVAGPAWARIRNSRTPAGFRPNGWPFGLQSRCHLGTFKPAKSKGDLGTLGTL